MGWAWTKPLPRSSAPCGRSVSRDGITLVLTWKTLRSSQKSLLGVLKGKKCERIERKSGAGLDPCTHIAGVIYGRARHAGCLDRLEHDSPAPWGLNRGAGVDGECLYPELRRAADDGCGAGRPVRSQAHVHRRTLAVRRRIGCLRARAKRRLADCRTCRPGMRCGAGDAIGGDASERSFPRRAAGEGVR